MIQSKSIGSRIFNVFNVILMTLLSVSCIYPLWYAFCLSVSSKSAANSGLVTFYPVGFSLASYQQIMGDAQFFRSFLISVERTVLGTIVTMLILIIFAYPLSKPVSEYRPKNVIMWIVIFCMLFNGGTIPWYITMVKYGLIDNIWGLVLCGGLPVFNLILLINFYRGIPKELIEAAQVDGAGEWRILFRIVVPCAIPVLATLILFTSVGYWNEFFQGLVLSSGEQMCIRDSFKDQIFTNSNNKHSSVPYPYFYCDSFFMDDCTAFPCGKFTYCGSSGYYQPC